ncbi:hypothetical protein [Gordonia sihwensis]|uniref:Uncharacterized protein n=1 Tax=Gordonia sihwensis NBRC 108236 TaxID=1223544 RepID=L7LGV1_9ACTN|nr:hypothetical protein [Gordonia sihwensis]GAC59327.1 hypothetical protein GSI01S_01_02930 [Gordonia sihwensis NBRC 108236]
MSDDPLMVGDCGDVVAADPYADICDRVTAYVEEMLDAYFVAVLGHSPTAIRGDGWLRPLLGSYELADRQGP